MIERVGDFKEVRERVSLVFRCVTGEFEMISLQRIFREFQETFRGIHKPIEDISGGFRQI